MNNSYFDDGANIMGASAGVLTWVVIFCVILLVAAVAALIFIFVRQLREKQKGGDECCPCCEVYRFNGKAVGSSCPLCGWVLAEKDSARLDEAKVLFEAGKNLYGERILLPLLPSKSGISITQENIVTEAYIVRNEIGIGVLIRKTDKYE